MQSAHAELAHETHFTRGSVGTYRVVAWKRCAAVVPLQREMKYCAGTAESSSTSCSTAAADSWGITAQPSPGDGNTRQVDAAGATPQKQKKF